MFQVNMCTLASSLIIQTFRRFPSVFILLYNKIMLKFAEIGLVGMNARLV